MRVLIALLFALALLPPAGAQDCVPTTSTTDEDTTVLVLTDVGGSCATLCYVVVDHPSSPCGAAIWVYPEANGVEGLQRGDECHDDTCGGQTESDTYLF